MKLPNILITGTPGTGKTETSQLASSRTGLRHINVGEIVKQHDCYEEKNEEYDTYILNEDKLLDVLEPMMDGGGCLIDFHSVELFPERWFSLVLVLRTETSILFDRLTERNYNDKKRSENMECEIMQVVLEEARESYDPEIVYEIPSNTYEDLENNVTRIISWLDKWKIDNSYIN